MSESWKEEFLRIKKEWRNHDSANTCSICDSPDGHTTIEDFIRSLVEKTRRETIKECDDKVMTIESRILEDGFKAGIQQAIELVKRVHDKKVSELHGGFDDADYLSAYQMAVEDIIQELKKKV